MAMAISSVKFSFNDIMQRQIDGVVKGSPLGPALATIFVDCYESKLFQTISKPKMYYRYMDDVFVVFRKEDECDLFLDSLNSLHTSLRFIFEKESNPLSRFWMCWLKNLFHVHHLLLPETHIHRSISTLEFPKSAETQN